MDMLYLFIAAISAFFVVLVAALVVIFAVKFRRRHAEDVGADIHGSLVLELTWTFIPFAIAMVMFVWGADLFFRLGRPPADAMDVFVVGKQWMWKVQHPSGVREINEMHVPVGRPIRITLGSEDVLHDYFIPAMRVKMDAVPGKLTTLWFTATTPGTYHLFCAEYCGTKHSGMIGQVIVMPPQAYEAWIAANQPSINLVEAGQRLFEHGQQCSACHKEDGSGRGPSLAGLFGSTVQLADGRTAVADENYLRESIVNPSAKIARGFSSPSIMPTYQGSMSEERLIELVAYLKTLRPSRSE
ncbi:MAG: cytochrome c oxidase subunit II [Acidobacteria bacterium]|nr:cytochrome c oxidase subunit II [Acidobacteriota bacterium]